MKPNQDIEQLKDRWRKEEIEAINHSINKVSGIKPADTLTIYKTVKQIHRARNTSTINQQDVQHLLQTLASKIQRNAEQ